MYSKIALFAAAAMATFVSALPAPGSQYSQCDTGSAQCCNDTQSSTSASGAQLLGLLRIVGVVDGLIGVNCTPIVGGNSCNQQAVCCNNNNFNGLIVIGCTPINANL